LYFNWNSADLVAVLILMAIFHLRVVRSEEPALRSRFGDIYEEYCRSVPRWIPQLTTDGKGIGR
jgi:protein-S-isoprenylcysteine O-methyltransferase Ste14